MTHSDEVAAAKERAWREQGTIDGAFARGEIDDAEWHRRVLAIIEPAYVGASTPQGQSGHSGDAERWEQARRLILDGVDRDGIFLDVGCANGLLMESLAIWAADDGHALTPYGVEISAVLADLARQRLPAWADRIWTANAASFVPPHLFTYVRTGLDYVPLPRRRAYVEHLLAAVVAPDGRLIIGTYNEETDRDDLAAEVERWGLRLAGRTSRPHQHPRLSYKAIWVDAATA